jgi:hypothetical protein
MQFFTGFESDGLARCDGDFGACSGVATDAGLAWFYGEDTKAAKLNAVTRNESLLHAFEDGIDGRLRFCSRKAGTFNHPLYEILLNHLGRRPWAVIFIETNTDLIVR